MSRPLVVLNGALVAVMILAAAYVVRELRAPAPGAARRAAPAAAAAPATSPIPYEVPPGTYSLVAARNLFSPTRSEAPPSAVAGAPSVAKPNLFGIILRDGAPVAYLEDPATKRVGGYRLGDSVAGGTLKQIAADHVVLNRPDGDLNVRLRDPSKPRPPVPTAPGQPAMPGVPTIPGIPGMPGSAPGTMLPGAPTPFPTVPGAPPTATMPQPLAPGLGPPPPGALPVLPRRPVPPLIRRVPPGTDAPAQN